MCYRFTSAERCVNCGYNMCRGLARQGKSNVAKNTKNHERLSNFFEHRVGELPEPEIRLLKSWLPPVEGLEEYPLCVDCEDIVRELAAKDPQAPRAFGHETVCFACGISMHPRKGVRHRAADFSRPDDQYLHEYAEIHQFKGRELRLCHACNLKAVDEVRRQESLIQPKLLEIEIKPSPSVEMETEEFEDNKPSVKQLRSGAEFVNPRSEGIVTKEITLDGYMKVVEKSVGKCAACGEASSRHLNLPTRQQLLLHKKLYVSTSARVCEKHMDAKNWTKIEKVPCAFIGEEIADMIFLLKMIRPVDLGNIEDIHPVILKRWLGVTHEEFRLKLEQKPSLAEQDGGRFSLAVYLAQQLTGECATVLASLCQRPRGAVLAAIQLAHRCEQGNKPSSKLEKFLTKV
ncbi:hypothetical protein NE865_12690 [Phthorimaea operculella]|nr:hypothetical protein NE865_12690 [Phthorimaea operculella]